MMDQKIKFTERDNSSKKESVKFFKNPILNMLSHTSATTVNALYIPLALFFLYKSFSQHFFLIVILGMILGAVIWSFVEYFFHRFLFHFKFVNEKIKYLHSIFHLAHHKYTYDTLKYQTLLLVSMPSAFIFYFFFQYVFSSYADSVYAGFILGYVFYEFVHYSTHQFKMNGKFAKLLKQHHMRHHYFDDSKNFGVSSPLWDYVFNTKSEKMELQNSNSKPV